MIKLSVVIPVYNSDRYINDTLNSVLTQDYKDIEVIVVNDGSTDNSKAILDQWKKQDNRLRVISQDNTGVSTARFKGIEIASGDYITFVDSDDLVSKNMYTALMEYVENGNYDIVHCGFEMFFTDQRLKQFYGTGAIKIQDQHTGVKDLIEGKFVEPGVWNKIYKKSLFKNLKIDLSIKYNEDLLMNFYLFSKAEKSLFVDQCYYKYRVHGDSVSHKPLTIKRIYDPISVKEIIVENISPELENIAKSAYIKTCFNIYNSMIVEGKTWESEKSKIKELIYSRKKWINFLGKKQRYLCELLLMSSNIYEIVYSMYSFCARRKKYE